MKRHLFYLLLATSIIALPGPLPTVAQEDEKEIPIQIEIVNQDGEKIKSSIVAPKPPKAPQEGQGTRIESKDGKIIIVDSDGKRRELKVGDAASVIVKQSVKRVNDDGQQSTTSSGKVVIVGPDGKRQEIELGDAAGQLDLAMPNAEWLVPQGSGVFRFKRADNKYMLGVFCEPVGGALASQLRLPEDTGLVVVNVAKDSPADKAGLELHDVLLYAGQTDLTGQNDLIKAVQEAGKENQEMTLEIIRGGRESEIKVKPIERPEGEFSGPDVKNMMKMQFIPELRGQQNFEFRALEPGVIIGQPFEEFDEQMQKRLETQMKQMEQQMQQLRKQMEQEFRNNDK